MNDDEFNRLCGDLESEERDAHWRAVGAFFGVGCALVFWTGFAAMMVSFAWVIMRGLGVL